MKVTFLRSIIAAGEHREANTSAEISDAEAKALIAAGDCKRDGAAKDSDEESEADTKGGKGKK